MSTEIKQTTFVYCPRCEYEMVSGCCYTGETVEGMVEFYCTWCSLTSLWDFDAPVPVLMEKRDE